MKRLGLAIQLGALIGEGVLIVAGGMTADVCLGMILGIALGVGLALSLSGDRDCGGVVAGRRG